MLRVAALAALAGLAAGCTVEDACRGGTVLVALSLSGDTANADELVVDVALDGAAPHESTLPHAPGSGAGNVVVQFPSGYPRGHSVALVVVARAAGAVLGRGDGSILLSDDCEALPLTVAPGALDGGDDAGADLADAAPPDLTPPSDLAECVPVTENCFNGVDDDCDGQVDCDDPDCTTIAVCVPPVTGAFVVGTTLATASLCPQSYTSLEVIDSGLGAAPNCSTGCSCGTSCFTQLDSFGNTSLCGSTDNENQFSLVDNTSCHSWNSWDNTLDVHQMITPASCTASGTPLLPTASWSASKRVCSTALHGGGCSGGNWCVPLTPGPSCEIAAGSQSCDTGYDAVAGPWYTGFNDTRACSCSCGAPTGSCGTTVTLYTDKNCTTGAASFASTAQNNIFCPENTAYGSGRVNATPTCGAPTYNPETGALTPTGLQTLCCVP